MEICKIIGHKYKDTHVSSPPITYIESRCCRCNDVIWKDDVLECKENKFYSKNKLGWNYEFKQVLVIEYYIFFIKFYRFHYQDKEVSDVYSFDKIKHEKRRDTKIKIDKKEFKNKYCNNKWLVPINFELDLSLK